MKREIMVTSDGSHTIFLPQKNVTYHSKHGAIQESRHVFIQAGMCYVLSQHSFTENYPLCIFEMGFGTGLNALLSFEESVVKNIPVYYFAVEAYPLSVNEAAQLNYAQQLNDERLPSVFSLLYEAEWNKDIPLTSCFTVYKAHVSLLTVEINTKFHLIYFDAFAPDIQPGLWQISVFEKLYNILYPNGVFVTYCCKGTVRRALQEAGFTVEKLPGAPGKREMIRAVKTK